MISGISGMNSAMYQQMGVAPMKEQGEKEAVASDVKQDALTQSVNNMADDASSIDNAELQAYEMETTDAANMAAMDSSARQTQESQAASGINTVA